MKKFYKNSIKVLLIVFILMGVTWKLSAFAATAPTLSDVANFAVLGATTVTNTGSSVLNGDLGLYSGTSITGFFGTTANEGPGVVSAGYAVHQTDAMAHLAQTAATNAYNSMSSQSCGGNDLSGQNLGGKTLTPGVYCFTSTAQLTGTLTLNAQGNPNAVWIFQVGTALTIDNSASVVITNGGTGTPGCNVYWQVGSAATIGTSATFIGTVIADSEAVTLNTGATMYGRAISRVAAVTLNANTITIPTCVSQSSSPNYGTINVVKMVINDNGGTKTVADFRLLINDMFVASGITNRFGASNFQPYQYTVTENVDSQYTHTFSGDCNADGNIYLNPNEDKFCIITNNDIGAPVAVPPVPPIIDVVKVPSPLALPDGPGLVNYTYTLRNIGIVPATDITMVGDTCSPIILASGDINTDSKLDLNETWIYRCSTTLSETHTNTVVATGWANGISATDIASAKVIVGIPIVPPLIHVTKIPSPLTLSAKGGIITYTEKITNPGTVALNNVKLIDDKCTPMKYISGDINKDSKLDINETWTYTCSTNLTKTTSNTAIASGEANGLTVRDLAVATVVVATAVPSLPNTGLFSEVNNIPWNIVLLFIVMLVSVLFVLVSKKHKI